VRNARLGGQEFKIKLPEPLLVHRNMNSIISTKTGLSTYFGAPHKNRLIAVSGTITALVLRHPVLPVLPKTQRENSGKTNS
jgi:hypothetical protein